METAQIKRDTLIILFLFAIFLAAAVILLYLEHTNRFTIEVQELQKEIKEIPIITNIIEPGPTKITLPPPPTKTEILIATTATELKIFNLTNQQRFYYQLEQLELDGRISQMSRAYSQQMYSEDFINHTDPEGIGFSDRFSNAQIYTLCSGENLFLIENFAPETDIAKEAVDGWMNSKGHRENILKPEFTHIGVGVHCQENKCYATQNFACLSTTLNDTLRKKFIYFYPLYSDEVNFDVTVEVTIRLESQENVDVYIVPNKEQQENIAKRRNFEYFESFRNIKRLDTTAYIKRGNGLVITPTDDTEITMSLTYR